MTIVKYFHLLSMAIWTGSMIFFSFIGAPAVFKALDRQTAGDVVGEIFPKYFAMGIICCLIAIVTLAMMGKMTGYTSEVRIGLGILLVMACLASYSGLVNGPQAREVKRLTRIEQDTVKKEELRKQFGKLHGISVMVNLTTIAMALGVLWLLPRYISQTPPQ